MKRSPKHATPRQIMGRLIRRAAKPPGTTPGTLIHTGQRKTEHVRIRTIDYDERTLQEREHGGIEEALAMLHTDTVTWLNIDGLHDAEVVETVGKGLGLHRLVMEDVMSTNQRPKVEEYADHYFIVLKMLSFDERAETVVAEQVSFIVGDRFVVTFQERPGDVFEPVRERMRQAKGKIRSRGADYLAYTLMDAVVDGYFRVLEVIGDHIEALETSVLEEPTVESLHKVHDLKRETLVLRRSVWPLRDVLGQLSRGEVEGVLEETKVFLRDVYDHAIQVIDTVETMRELLSATMDLYMSGVSNRMNEVMKVLTIIATIFIPLSFFAGLYGMNFQYMPELGVRWAYPALLGFMLLVALGMLGLFRRRGWI